MLSKKTFLLLTSYIILSVAFNACRKTYLIEGRSELISVDDFLLGDSALFVGYVKPIEWPDSIPYGFPSEVWLEPSNQLTLTDSLGFYSIKTLPGRFTIKCQNKYNSYPELIEQLKDFDIKSNQKVRIDFFLGSISE